MVKNTFVEDCLLEVVGRLVGSNFKESSCGTQLFILFYLFSSGSLCYFSKTRLLNSVVTVMIVQLLNNCQTFQKTELKFYLGFV